MEPSGQLREKKRETEKGRYLTAPGKWTFFVSPSTAEFTTRQSHRPFSTSVEAKGKRRE